MKNKSPKLITKRLVLRSLKSEDKKYMVPIFSDEKVKKTYMIPDFENQEQIDAFFIKLENLTLSDKHIAYAITLKNQVIGFVNSVSIDNDSIEMGYFISSSFWNNGYATEAFTAVINELFRMGFNKILAAHFDNNPASGRVMEKCGMKKIAHEETIFYRGNNYRCIYYQINK